MVVCPRHGSRFDLETGIPMSLPAFESVPTYPVLRPGGRHGCRRGARRVIDERVLRVLARLEAEDRDRTVRLGLPAAQRSRQVEPTTGRFLFALAACQAGIEVLEIGASRGLLVDLACGGGARAGGPQVTLLEHDPAKCAAWRANVADAGLDEWVDLVEGDAFEILLGQRRTPSTSSSSTPRRTTTKRSSPLPGPLLEPGGLVVADNVLSHAETLAAYSAARQADSALSSVTVPLDRGLELSVVLGAPSCP